MSSDSASVPLLTPLHVELPGGHVVAGTWLPGEGRLTLIFLHDLGADLDAVMPVAVNVGVPEANKLALDLPGHGLSSSGDQLPILSALLDQLAAEDSGPFVIVGHGHSASLAWALGTRPDVLALALVSPVLDDALLPAIALRLPVIVFVAEASPEVAAAWQALKVRLRARWMSVSMHVSHEDLAGCADHCSRQTASHLNGFVRNLLAG
jgi:pimeloyl-ACP methyl ester carboxylesterase